MSKLTGIVAQLSGQEYETGFSMTRPSSMTFGHSTPDTQDDMLARWISSLGDFPASPSLSLENGRGPTMSEICGRKPSNLLASYDRDSHSWKMSQISLLTNTLDKFSETWPKSGMIVNGILYQQPSLVPHTWDGDCLCWLSRPTASMTVPSEQTRESNRLPSPAETTGQFYLRCGNLIPTPGGNQQLPEIGSSSIMAPQYAEWLMGWPIGWTDLKPLEMDGFRKWLTQFCK